MHWITTYTFHRHQSMGWAQISFITEHTQWILLGFGWRFTPIEYCIVPYRKNTNGSDRYSTIFSIPTPQIERWAYSYHWVCYHIHGRTKGNQSQNQSANAKKCFSIQRYDDICCWYWWRIGNEDLNRMKKDTRRNLL